MPILSFKRATLLGIVISELFIIGDANSERLVVGYKRKSMAELRKSDPYKNTKVIGHINDYTPEKNFSSAIQLHQGGNELAQRQQTLKFLQSKGYSDEEAQAVAQTPDLAMRIMSDTLGSASPQEGYRVLTQEEKVAQGLPNDTAFQASTQADKLCLFKEYSIQLLD
ncbi:hypothetical protein [Bartonella sp. WD16.2]|uniref:hypothetical protein n=1 Tax=Bartonella sp. WD16.2 TaxID=1933904 RepID=UPI00099A194C|nr:hypothetical protein [Bartonella sp. WD16.2]AQX19993.1 hypothetical protein BWD162_008810 [Bartonella sp. WD16.2]